jgi:hypothetical protein
MAVTAEPSMTVSGRRGLALLSACGLVLSITAYISSLFSAWIELNLMWMIPLVLGAIGLVISIRIVEPSVWSVMDFWRRFNRTMPRWVSPCLIIVCLIAAGHFVWFTLHGVNGQPGIREGQYVLYNNHREFIKVLTQSEYFALRGAQLRMIASVLVAMYLLPTVYWSFKRSE